MTHPLSKVVTAVHVTVSRLSRPFGKLFVVSDGADWVLREEARELAAIARGMGIPAAVIDPPRLHAPQCFHFTSQFTLINPRFHSFSRRMSVDFFHGSSQSNPHFSGSLDALKNFRGDVLRVRVSNRKVHEWLLAEGIAPDNVHRIPIGIRDDLFTPPSPERRREMRRQLGFPENAFIVGSFQKDGVGWGAGNEPKLIKGPDILVDTLTRAKKEIPNLHVLLSGPARGYVKSGLERLGIPYRHVFLKKPGDVARLYHALDAYLIAARDEGGPKGFLESLASHVPCVSTRVGQVADLAEHGATAFLADLEDASGLALGLVQVRRMSQDERSRLIAAGRRLAEAHSYNAQRPLWEKFFSGYVIR